MKEIFNQLPVYLEIKEWMESIIDAIPIFAFFAFVGAVQDIPGTINALKSIAEKIHWWMDHGRY